MFTRGTIFASLALLLVSGFGCSSASEDGTDDSSADSATPSLNQAALTDATRRDVTEKKATCPFVGAAVFMKKLNVLNSGGNPLARIDDIAALGNVAGGNLGSTVLTLFARGNQHRMHGVTQNPAGQTVLRDDLSEEVPSGTFSLDFPQSQGSHAGHSGILEQGPHGGYKGLLTQGKLDDLFNNYAVDEAGRKRGADGYTSPKYLRRSDLGSFVWDNVSGDPASVYLGHGMAGGLLNDFRVFHAHPSIEGIVKFTGTNNIVGSSGEFGLLFTLLEKPDLKVNGDAVISVDEVRTMFVDKQLPAGWDAHAKTGLRWVENTTAIMTSAEGSRFLGWF